ncbi:hypothetical protein AVEN_223792-1 [Araneus ventricosus]|uniref:Uncharacterized protein n=1 Tax=Araneus ventricosus TaxID=182803 RepID=A0A4Y2DKD8_ARAVE|nr:hypothetical protein AVEN_223792-1 [Araneus ventricosus]
MQSLIGEPDTTNKILPLPLALSPKTASPFPSLMPYRNLPSKVISKPYRLTQSSKSPQWGSSRPHIRLLLDPTIPSQLRAPK